MTQRNLMWIFVFVLFLFSLSPGYAQVYKWTDENGVVHYSNAPKGRIPGKLVKMEGAIEDDFTNEEVPRKAFLSGVGRQLTERFPLTRGIFIFRMNHDGQNEFSIRLINSSGAKETPLAGAKGSYTGAVDVRITKSGDYRLDIEADGSWDIVILPSEMENLKKDIDQGDKYADIVSCEEATEIRESINQAAMAINQARSKLLALKIQQKSTPTPAVTQELDHLAQKLTANRGDRQAINQRKKALGCP